MYQLVTSVAPNVNTHAGDGAVSGHQTSHGMSTRVAETSCHYVGVGVLRFGRFGEVFSRLGWWVSSVGTREMGVFLEVLFEIFVWEHWLVGCGF